VVGITVDGGYACPGGRREYSREPSNEDLGWGWARTDGYMSLIGIIALPCEASQGSRQPKRYRVDDEAGANATGVLHSGRRKSG